jgi:hypothetical protein
MKTFIYSTLAIGLIGCASKPVVYYQVPAGNKIAIAQSENVNGLRFQENVKAYPLGRYRDPRNPRMMHERHLAYRVEQDSSWDYSPNQNFVIPLGKVEAVSRPNSASSFKSALSEVEIKKQKDQNAVLTEQNKALLQRLDKIEEENKQINQLTLKNKELQKELSQVQIESQSLRQNLEEKSHAQTVVEQPKKPSLWKRFTSLMPNK